MGWWKANRMMCASNMHSANGWYELPKTARKRQIFESKLLAEAFAEVERIRLGLPGEPPVDDQTPEGS